MEADHPVTGSVFHAGSQIARMLRISDISVRTYLRREAEKRERLRADAERRARKRT